MVLLLSIFLLSLTFFSLIIFLTREKPFECRPDDFMPIMRSFCFNLGLIFFKPLFAPTQKPARSYLSFASTPGCSAVSPPKREQFDFLQPSIIPFII